MTATYDIGDSVLLTFTVLNSAGTPTAATVALTLTDPDGTTSTPTVSTASTGVYTATVAPTVAGAWLYRYVATGAVTTAEDGLFLVRALQAASLYATLQELKAYLNISDTVDDAPLEDALSTASRMVDKECGRQFTRASAATARVFTPSASGCLEVDDFYTTTGLVIGTDTADDGTYETTWQTTDYRLEPLNGVVDGESGWPYSRIVIRSAGAQYFPLVYGSPSVSVTAKWGWAAVPSAVKQAALLMAADVFKMKDAPFGIGGFGDWGPMRVRDNPMASRLLAPYRREPVKVG